MDSRWDFDRWAATYDQSVSGGWIHQDYERVIDSLAQTIVGLSRTKPARMLDIGAGTGNLEARLANTLGLTIDVIEPSDGMRTELRKKCRGIRILEGQLPDLPQFHDKYDIIVSSYVIHHIDHDKTGLMIERICQNLSPGGIVLLADVMFESEKTRDDHISQLKASGKMELVEEILDEPFQFIDHLSGEMVKQHLQMGSIKRFTFYTFCVQAKSII